MLWTHEAVLSYDRLVRQLGMFLSRLAERAAKANGDERVDIEHIEAGYEFLTRRIEQ